MAYVQEVPRRVMRGAVLLDQFAPGWESVVDEKKLDIGSCKDCVISQRFGNFSDGLRRLAQRSVRKALSGSGVELSAYSRLELDSFHYGFDARSGASAEYSLLGQQWYAEIINRRNAKKKGSNKPKRGY